MDSNPNVVNLHIKAKDESTLERLQFANNIINQRVHNYQTPYESSNGGLVVWYYADITNTVRVDASFLDNSKYAEMDLGTMIEENNKIKRSV
jgi:hypothetical protein